MGYSQNEKMCRCDIFKDSGKWYDTIEIEFENWSKEYLIHNEFKKALYKKIGTSFKGYYAICLKPYHELEHPLMMVID